MNDLPPVIQGIGVVGGFGSSHEDLMGAVRCGGRPNGTVSVLTAAGARTMPTYLADESQVRRYASAGALRRTNRYARLAMLGASLALEDAGWDLSLPCPDLGLIVASGYGASQSTFDFLDTMIEDAGSCPSPTLFSNSVHSSAAAHLSILLRTHGPCLTVSQFEMSPVSALLTARQWLCEGRVQAVLLGAVEEICPVLSYAYDRLFGVGAAGPIEPFNWDRQTAVPGEGAAFLLLTQEQGSGGYGTLKSIEWLRVEDVVIDVSEALVLGADGQVCSARAYRRLAARHRAPVAYSQVYGSLPGGQAFDLAVAAVAARHGVGAVCANIVKCDSQDNCGVVACCFRTDEC